MLVRILVSIFLGEKKVLLFLMCLQSLKSATDKTIRDHIKGTA